MLNSYKINNLHEISNIFTNYFFIFTYLRELSYIILKLSHRLTTKQSDKYVTICRTDSLFEIENVLAAISIKAHHN